MLLALLFFLLASHALMDFALQSETMASCKCRRCDNPIARLVPWYYWLTAHAVLHGAGVGAVLRWFGYDWNLIAAFACAETAVHALIDHGKCQNWYAIGVDQAMHVACKLLWWGLLASGAIVL